MIITNKKISDLIPYANNARTHSDNQITQIASSIKEFGFNNPVLIDKDNGIIAGHGRVEAAKKLAMEEVPTILLDHLTESQKKAFILADNRIAMNSEWDHDLLSLELTGLETEFDLTSLGFDPKELLSLLEPEEVEGQIDDDEVPEVPEEPNAKPGDVYQLGNHRLMCGSSTSYTDVEKLMDGKVADMVHTDPPYNVSIGTIKHPKFKQREIKNDSMSTEDFIEFCREWAGNIKSFCNGIIYCWAGQGKDGRAMFTVLDEYFHNSTTIIWVKDQFTLGRGKYQNQYEPCWFGWNGDGNNFTDDRTLVNVWNCKRPQRSELHPTMKPIELCEMAIKHGTRSGQLVLDLFGGSGSTMIACEKQNRSCYMMELDPKYVDVIIKRWEEFTGEDAVLLGQEKKQLNEL